MHIYVCTSTCVFFFNDAATTEIYTLSLHDALPIYRLVERHVTGGGEAADTRERLRFSVQQLERHALEVVGQIARRGRSEEHTSELQSHSDLVCRLLLEKKKKKRKEITDTNDQTSKK